MRRAALALSVLLGSCRNPRADANIAQAMIDAETAINEVRQEQAMMQSEIDSLRQVVSTQDTIIRRLVTHTGLPLILR
jgi:hypothetical protein